MGGSSRMPRRGACETTHLSDGHAGRPRRLLWADRPAPDLCAARAADPPAWAASARRAAHLGQLPGRAGLLARWSWGNTRADVWRDAAGGAEKIGRAHV